MSERSRVLVTGASSGFGRKIACALATAGHHVFAGVREPAGRGALARADLEAWAADAGVALEVIALDVTSEASIDTAVEAITTSVGGVDILVNNAGVAAAGLIETFSASAAQKIFDVNVFGLLRMMRAVLPGMRAQGRGLVVHVSSTDGREVMPFLGLYNASKFAVEALADAWRYEIEGLGIETVVIQPGTFPTTNILANLVPADDPGRAAGYGAVAEGPGQLFAAITRMIEDGSAPSPELVATEVARIVALPHGTRPTRVVVDPSGFDGAHRINAVCDEVQRDLLAQTGLTFLDRRTS